MKLLKEDMAELRRRKESAEEAHAAKKKADEAFHLQEQIVLERSADELGEDGGMRVGGYFFTPVYDKVRGQVTDKSRYLRWALENDETIDSLFDTAGEDGLLKFASRVELIDCLMNLTLVKVEPRQQIMNEQARAAQEDGVDAPPGLDWRPVPYVSMNKTPGK